MSKQGFLDQQKHWTRDIRYDGSGEWDDIATEEDISRVEAAFKSVGIAIRDMNGEFREVPVVLMNWQASGKFSKVQGHI